MLEVPRDIIWRSMTGRQAMFAVGRGDVRRYGPGLSPIVGLRDPAVPNFDHLAEVSEPGEAFFCDGFTGRPPLGWTVEFETTMFKMIWNGSLPSSNFDAESMPIQLSLEDAPKALELAELTNPGPFGVRTLELGDYFGYFEGSQLIAMAGERMWAEDFREISGVCTHPDHQGRGYARKLIQLLISRQLAKGQVPFLHVLSENGLARDLYCRLGFRYSVESVVRVMSRSEIF